MYLIDTNILSYFIRQNQDIINQFNIYSDQIILSTVVEMECFFGAEKANQLELIDIYKEIFATYPSLTFDSKAARIFGKIKSKCQKSGKNIEDFDLMLAAQALAHNLILVTNNVKHFKNIDGLMIEDWSKLKL